MPKGRMKRTSIGLLLLLAGFTAGLILTGHVRSANETAAQPVQNASQTIAIPAAVPSGLPDLTKVAAQAVQGVVNISSVTVVRTPNSPFANDPMFQYFFG